MQVRLSVSEVEKPKPESSLLELSGPFGMVAHPKMSRPGTTLVYRATETSATIPNLIPAVARQSPDLA